MVNRKTATERERLRSPYSVWWAAVAKASERQGDKVSVKWVKGHAGNAGNTMADIVAKAGHTKDAWDMNPAVHTDMKCHATFKGQLVEDDLRQVLKKQSVARTHRRWANQNRTKAMVPEWQLVEWRTTIAIVHNGSKPRSLFTSNSDCTKRAHRVKKLHGMLPTQKYMHNWRPDLYEDDYCRVCESDVEDTNHIWRCPETLTSQCEGWEETMELVTNLGKKLWKRAKDSWESDKKKAEEEGKEFKKKEPTFSNETMDNFWTMLMDFFKGARNIRAQNLLDDDMEREEVADHGSLAWRQWTVIDAYHGVAPLSLKDKINTLFCTTQEIASIMADRFIKGIEDYGRTGIWNPRCKKTVDWEKSIGVTGVSKRTRPKEPGTRAGGHGGSNSNFGNFNRDRFDVTRMKRLYRAADKDVLDAYQGKRVLNAMERTGGVKYFLEKDLGD